MATPTPRAKHVFLRAKDTRSALFVEALALVQKTFPPSEMHPPHYMRRWVKQGTYLVDAAQDAKGRVVFAGWHWRMTGTRIQMLDYIAAHPSARGLGIADAYMRHYLSRYASRGRLALVEIEQEKLDDAKQRWLYRFYRKHGARRLEGVDFVLPPLTSGKPVRLAILLFGLKRKTIPGVLARKLCRTIYEANDEFSPPGTRKTRQALLETFLKKIPKRVRLV